ncbi:MAG: magnesium transporter [Gemmatimonadota bacterium]|jgi:magnesium transporter
MDARNEIDIVELAEAWSLLPLAERVTGFKLLKAGDAEEFFFDLDAHDQAEVLSALPASERRLWIRLLAPDDAADLIQAADEEHRAGLLNLLDETKRREVSALLAYAEDEAGGLMSSRFARVRPDMTVDEAIAYLRRQAVATIEPETIYYMYVLDSAQKLLGVLSFRDLFASPGNRLVREIMVTDVLSAHEEMDQEALAHLFSEHDLLAVPVVDGEGHLKGIVTVDDIVDVVEEEATEDIQKLGGMVALDEPYLRISFFDLVRKRVGWLTVLFFAQLLTATVIDNYSERIQAITALAIFIPLILSSGGNSGSQASTLVIRALTIDEVRLRDWWRVARRELATGVTMGTILGLLGLGRVTLGAMIGEPLNTDILRLAFTIAISLVAVVVFGTIVGSMLPFALRRAGLDPASASGPLVSTLSDVTGLLIYFTIATLIIF